MCGDYRATLAHKAQVQHTSVQCSTAYFRVLQSCAEQCSAVQCNTIKCNTACCDEMLYSAVLTSLNLFGQYSNKGAYLFLRPQQKERYDGGIFSLLCKQFLSMKTHAWIRRSQSVCVHVHTLQGLLSYL